MDGYTKKPDLDRASRAKIRFCAKLSIALYHSKAPSIYYECILVHKVKSGYQNKCALTHLNTVNIAQ